MAVDFVPDTCLGTALFQCIQNKDCEMENFVKDLSNPLNDMGANFDIAFGDVGEATTTINDVNSCLIAALTTAITTEGISLPTFPPSAPTPDFTSTQNELSSMANEISTPLGYLDSTFTLEETAGVITRIQSP